MRFSTSAQLLSDALSACRKVVPATPQLAAHAGVLFDVSERTVKLLASDGNVTLSATVQPVTGLAAGKVLVPPKAVAQLIDTLPTDVQVDVYVDDDSDVVVAAEGARPYRFRPLPLTFPQPPKVTSDLHDVDLSDLSAVLTAVRATIAKDGGVQLASEGAALTVVSLDEVRFTSVQLASGGFGPFQGVAVYELLDLLARHEFDRVAVDSKGRHLRAVGPKLEVIAQMLDVPFRDTSVFIDAMPDVCATVPRNELLLALRRLQAIGDTSGVELHFAGGQVELSASVADVGSGSEVVAANIDAQADFTCKVNRKFFADAVGSHADDNVGIRWSGPVQPLFITSDVPAPTVSVVMPMRT